MKPIADSILMDWQEKLTSAGATVEVGRLPSVLAEPAHMRQLLQNLLDNALKFRSGTRPLVIRISARQEDDVAHFSVSDNGIGLEAQYKDRVFRVFQRLHPTNRYSGTGIGLAICKKIVEGYGGRIWVESQPGQGSVFHFTLPTPTDETNPPAS
jgi:light-regulated signal transduction histidine kinase (bacteriophytochrome)